MLLPNQPARAVGPTRSSASDEQVDSLAREKMRQTNILEQLFALNRYALEGPLL
jgi:hypothetical protein